MKDIEKNMIRGIKAGKESAYSLLFDEYYRPLVVFAIKYVKDLDTAREIVQELFVYLYENRYSVLIATSLKSYLYQAVRNRCLNHLKYLKVKKKHLDQMALEKESTEEIESRILETELEYKIFQIISDLPPQCQKIFKLSRVLGLRNKEIAEQFQISIRTVETQISKALKVLRSSLGDDLIP